MATILHLVIPGLLAPGPIPPGLPRPEATALERLLGRARVTTLDAVGYDATLFQLFGLAAAPERDLPTAAVTRLVDGGDSQQGWWLRADPAHLQPDRNRLLLFDARSLDLDSDEVESLVAELNREFGSAGLQLDAPHPNRWYLRLDDDPGLRAYPLDQVIGRNINRFLPYDETKRRWRTLWTEIQMALHRSPINTAREARGRRPVNSLWFWGGGRLPHGARSPCDDVYAAEPLSRGLARLAGVAVSPLPDNAADWLAASEEDKETLVALEATRYDRADGNLYAWVGHVNALEANWFAPLLTLLDASRVTRLYLYSGDGRIFTVERGRWRHFWRRPRPVFDYVQHTDES